MKLFALHVGVSDSISKSLHGSMRVKPVVIRACSACHRDYDTFGNRVEWRYQQGVRVTDYVSSGSVIGHVCITGGVVSDLAKSDLQGWATRPIEKHGIPTELQPSVPEFHALVVQNHWGCLNMEASGLEGAKFCNECGKFMNGYRDPERIVLEQSSFAWEKSDLFHFQPFGILNIYVTHRFIEVARKHKWSNLYFTNLDSKYPHNGTVVDHLAKDWPPPGWGEA